MRVRRCLALVLFAAAAGPLAAASLETASYPDAAAAASAWAPMNADSAAPGRALVEDTRCLRFALPFSALKDWRFVWDKSGDWDLSQTLRLLVRVRADKPGALGPVVLYARSGPGWWRFPPFTVTSAWREVAIDRQSAVAEGDPAGWGSISALRLSVQPGTGGDAMLEIAGIEEQATLPESWVWQVGGARNSEEAFALVLRRAAGRAAKDARRRLTQAEGILSKAREGGARGEERVQALRAARAKVEEAYALGQAPLKPGIRGVWIHNGDGPRAAGGKRAARWKDAIPEMHAQGINCVVPNMLWSGVAFYPSAIVPNAPGVAVEGDYLQEILDAAHPLGMTVQVWKVMWQFAEGWLAPPGVSQPFREAGRLQMDDQGKELPWLCPCDERNRKYELDALLEVARRYPIDGIQLDYIRFNGPEAGFEAPCRARFEAAQGHAVANWPQDCAPGGALADAYADFKREVISSFVQQASAALRAARPGLVLSAAVFPYPQQARTQVSQDWPRWLKEGWLDYVCPMTYTEDAASFEAATRAQVALVGADKVLPGVQVAFDAGRVADLASTVDQVKAAAALGTPGTFFFEWREQLQDTILPYLRNGLWKEGAYDLRFREIPAEQRRPQAVAGPKPAGGPKILWVDDFESGKLVNALGAPWSADSDTNNIGTRLDGMPLRPSAGGAHGSAHALGLKGHFGAARAPWPYAVLGTAFNPDRAPVDLSAYRHLVFQARGDGKPLEAVLKRALVKDYGEFKASVTPTADWKEYRLDLDAFSQPGWAEPLDRTWTDVAGLLFQPGSRNDEDFWFEIDDVRLEP